MRSASVINIKVDGFMMDVMNCIFNQAECLASQRNNPVTQCIVIALKARQCSEG